MFKESKLKNSFRILKGGKISLVTTALLLGANLNAAIEMTNINSYVTSNDTSYIIDTNTEIINTIDIFGERNTLTNNGTINGNHFESIYVSGSNNSIINNGTINAPAFFIHGSNIINSSYNVSFTNSIDGVINGSFNLFYGNVTNYGLINSTNSDFVFSYNRIGTFINESTGTLRINLTTDGTEQGTTYTSLMTTNATFENGSTIDVNVSNTSTNVGLLVGNTLTDVITSNSLTINGTLNVTDNSTLVDFKYEKNGNNLNLNIVKESTILDETKKGFGNKNAQALASKLDFINDNIGNYNSEVQSFITNLGTTNVKNAVDTLMSQISQSNLIASNQIQSGISSTISNRISNISSIHSSINSGDEVVVKDKTLWIKPFGSIGSQANKNDLNGFDVKSYGIGMGYDGKDKNDQMVGFGLFLANANVDMNNVNQESDIKAYTLAMYGAIPVIDNKTNFLYQLSYGLQDTDSSREIYTGEIATADYTSKMAVIDTRLVRDYQINKDLLLQPLVLATYKNFNTPSYSETGAGVANLNVEKSSSSEMIIGLGTMASYNLNTTDKLTGSLSAGYDLRDDENKTVSSFQNVSFESVGIDNGRWSYDAGIGYERSIDNNNSINVNYNFQGEGSDYKNNVVSANYVYKF